MGHQNLSSASSYTPSNKALHVRNSLAMTEVVPALVKRYLCYILLYSLKIWHDIKVLGLSKQNAFVHTVKFNPATFVSVYTANYNELHHFQLYGI